jgi:hypothetical protein
VSRANIAVVDNDLYGGAAKGEGAYFKQVEELGATRDIADRLLR